MYNANDYFFILFRRLYEAERFHIWINLHSCISGLQHVTKKLEILLFLTNLSFVLILFHYTQRHFDTEDNERFCYLLVIYVLSCKDVSWCITLWSSGLFKKSSLYSPGQRRKVIFTCTTVISHLQWQECWSLTYMLRQPGIWHVLPVSISIDFC